MSWRYFERQLSTIAKQLQFRLSKEVEIEGKGNRLIPLLIFGLFTWREKDLEQGIYEDLKADHPGAMCFLSVL